MRLILLALCLFVAPLAARAADGGTVVPEGEVRRVIGDYLAKRSATLNADTTVKRIGYSGELRLPRGTVEYEVISPDSWEGWGRTTLALVVRVDGGVKKNLTVPVEVEALVEMVVTTRTLERGEVIAEGDVALARRDLAKVGGRFCRDRGELIGKRAKMPMRANTPVRDDYVERVPLVKSGQLVTVLVENDAIKVVTSGRAKVSGALGDLITVQNVSSLKEFPARVVDANMVKVDFQ